MMNYDDEEVRRLMVASVNYFTLHVASLIMMIIMIVSDNSAFVSLGFFVLAVVCFVMFNKLRIIVEATDYYKNKYGGMK